MTLKTSEKIIQYITKKNQVSGKELSNYLSNLSSRAVRKQIKNLFDKGLIQKIGKPPKVYYSLKVNKEVRQDFSKIDIKIRKLIDEKYLYISASGEEVAGWSGFIAWCNKTHQNPIKTAQEYITTLKKYDHFRKGNLINGMSKMKQTLSHVYLDKLYYLDFYSIERFGKTKLGQMLLYAKQSQNIQLVQRLTNQIKPQITNIINKYSINAVMFIPPTVKREVQFMKELEKNLNLSLPTVNVVKIKTPIIIPQKTLSKLEDRIENAKKTIIVDEFKKYINILLIDDAVGSGATFNETAKQIKLKKINTGKIIGLAITGSFKGFDVISEV